MKKQEKQLRVLAKWLSHTDDGIDAYRDGKMEMAIKHATSDCMRKIGDYLEEILDMDDEQLNRE
tara:strand:- start:587 stop:778 length:192 start_codon:yes stop_codon:yes gene_type:complete